MAYIGIDQSYTGYAVVALNATTLLPTDYLGKFPLSKYSAQVDRLLDIEQWLDNALYGWDIDAICMEGYANGAKFGREMAGELGYATKRVLRRNHAQGLIPVVVPPTSVKKFVTGSGTSKKNEMLLGVYKRWGVEYKDDNLADAYSLARIAHAIDRPELERTKFQDEVLHKLSS